MELNPRRLILYGIWFANLAVVLAFWWHGSSYLVMRGTASSLLIAFGRVIGLISMLLILTQLVLIGRMRPVEREYGHDKLNRLHRFIGTYILCFLILHPIFLIIGYALAAEVSLWTQFITFITSWEDVLKAFFGLIIMIVVIGISISIVRKKLRYETWYFTHLLMYVAIFLLFNHQVNTADVSTGIAYYYWYTLNFTIFGLLLLYRFIRPLYVFNKHRFYVQRVVKETETVTSVYISGRNMEEFRFDAGQFANLTFLDKRMWYKHPFSFSKAFDGKNIRFSIKNVGDFTARIPLLKPGTHVIIDGPLGTFTERKSKKDKYLFIAGGIGITPIRALIESLAMKGGDMILLYGNRSEKEIAFKKELGELMGAQHHILSHQTSPWPGYETGYVDAPLIGRLAPDVIEREVYLCGPPPMMAFVLKELDSIGIPPHQIHHERFEY